MSNKKITELPQFNPGDEIIEAMAVEVNRTHRIINLNDHVYSKKKDINEVVNKILESGNQVFIMPFKP